MLETWEAAPLRGATRKTHKYLLLHNYLDGSDKRTLLVGPLDSLKVLRLRCRPSPAGPTPLTD